MSRAMHERAQARLQRREQLRRKFPIAGRILENPAVARMFIETAPFTRILIELGLPPTPGLGRDNHDAIVNLIKDALGIVSLSDAEFEHAIGLATPPECRETVQ